MAIQDNSRRPPNDAQLRAQERVAKELEKLSSRVERAAHECGQAVVNCDGRTQNLTVDAFAIANKAFAAFGLILVLKPE